MTKKADVLIVGAGPVGLSAAVALARSGTAVRIIDKLPQAINQSRAAIVHARTQEHFARLGILDEFLAEGVKVHGVVVYSGEGQILVRPSLDHLPSPYPYMLGLEQDKTEAILTHHLKKAGIEIERSVELVGFQDSGDYVSATLRQADGQETTEQFAYLLGADGSRSVVRHGLGFTMEGETIEQTWITVDVKIRWDRDPGEAVACLSEDGIVFIAAMNDDRWRVIVNQPSMTKAEAEAATLADVERLLNERLRTKVELYDCVWSSTFGINTRMAQAMRQGRVFLAGDAAHVHSPVGGQGMNTGIQDALNLAWKLDLVLKGAAKPALLDSFNEERHANAKRLLQRIGMATHMAALRHPVAIEIRNHVIHVLSHLGITRIMPGFVSMLDVGYPNSPAVAESHVSFRQRGPRAGERAPDALGLRVAGQPEPQHLFTLWAGDNRHQLLVFGSAPAQLPPSSPLYRVIRIVSEGEPAGDVVVDSEGLAHEAYAAHEGALYLVRPDGIIAFRSGDFDPAALSAYLTKWYNLS